MEGTVRGVIVSPMAHTPTSGEGTAATRPAIPECAYCSGEHMEYHYICPKFRDEQDKGITFAWRNPEERRS